MSIVHPGMPWPLGSSITPRGVNFSIAAPLAEKVELLLFANETKDYPQRIVNLDHSHKSGDYWHVEIEGLKEGCCYCYRICNTLEEEHKDYVSSKALIDPCARAIGGWTTYKRNDSKGPEQNLHSCLKGVVCERNLFDFKSHPRPNHPWNQSIIYELHVGGFTNHPESNVEPEKRSSFIGLIQKIPYLKDLGITAIELLPIYSFDPNDAPSGKLNYWGYSPINWFTPHQGYVIGNNPLNARNQFRELVAKCHDEGLEVILDVVYNHTAEGNQEGPILSWKGFGGSLYYHLDKKGNYLDVSGCGNTIAANRPLVRKLILESMRCWASELGIDGFRFDLGIALSRGENLNPLENPPLFEAIESDPELSGLKLISEPWDCGGLYKISEFPAKRISTWNGHFRDDVRKFWKGEKGSTWPLKERLMGSLDIYKESKIALEKSIQFITSHDGFTLIDLVSFNQKHNFANGENNRDGENHNISWNNGIEGPTTDISLLNLRRRQQRNLLTTLLLSPGVPMILMGDEVGRSQGGNNNSWCQDSPLGWMIWGSSYCDTNLHKYVKKLLKIRNSFPSFFSPITPHSEDSPSNINISIQWHGVKLLKPDWGEWSHTISYSLNRNNDEALLWVGFNAYTKSIFFELPKSKFGWNLILNTASKSPNDIPQKPIKWKKENIELLNQSIVVMLSEEFSSKLKL